MPMTTIAGHEVEVNEEGFLTKPDEWTEELAPELAKLIGLELGDDHWKMIETRQQDAQTAYEAWQRLLRELGTDPNGYPGQGPLHAVPGEARQEDGLRLGPAQAQGLCLSGS